jgi:hypothetical protein
MKRFVLCSLAAVPLVLSACYTSRPLQTSEPAAGTRVVIQLTEQGSEQVAPLLGPRIGVIEGAVESASPVNWAVYVSRLERRDQTEMLWNRERVTLPRAAFGSVEERRLDRRRSYALAGGITLAALVAARVFAGLGSSENGGGGTPVPVE